MRAGAGHATRDIYSPTPGQPDDRVNVSGAILSVTNKQIAKMILKLSFQGELSYIVLL